MKNQKIYFSADLKIRIDEIQNKLEYFIKSSLLLIENSQKNITTKNELLGLSLFGKDIIKDFNLLSQAKFKIE